MYSARKEQVNRIVAMQECANGNETIGTFWIATGVFEPETPLSEVIAWAKSCPHSDGRLIIREDSYIKPALNKAPIRV